MAKKFNGNIVLSFLEVDYIIDTKVENDRRLYLVQWKGYDYKSWVNVRCISSLNVLLKFYSKLIGGIDEKFPDLNVLEKVDNLLEILGESTGAEIDAIVQRHFTVNGLKLPFSKRNALVESLLYFIKNRSGPSISHMKQLRDEILIEKVLKLRSLQLEKLKRSEWEINLISDNKQSITITNNVDLETLPDSFVYINNYIAGTGVKIPTDPPIGCECSKYGCSWFKKKMPSGSCCPNFSDTMPAYDQNKRIILKKRTAIYECNKKCSCDETCPNRVVQNGSNIRLEIFRTFNQTGWGVSTLDNIPSGTFVSRYVGEVITFDEAEKRSKEYLFDLDFNYATDSDLCPYTVDAFKYGNITRFINHSCDPNLSVFGVLIDCLDPDFHDIAFFASRDIVAGEELCFNYRKFMKCKCGSLNCKLK